MDSVVFDGCPALETIYYVEGTTGWTNPWEGIPTATWTPEPKPEVAVIGISQPIVKEDGTLVLEITYEGTLQWSDNLVNWDAVKDAVGGKYQVDTSAEKRRFYRFVK